MVAILPGGTRIGEAGAAACGKSITVVEVVLMKRIKPVCLPLRVAGTSGPFLESAMKMPCAVRAMPWGVSKAAWLTGALSPDPVPTFLLTVAIVPGWTICSAAVPAKRVTAFAPRLTKRRRLVSVSVM